MAKDSLEERARKLLRYKITREGEVPNQFTKDYVEEVCFLIEKRYVTKSGGTPKSLSYNVTPEGEKWATKK
jgi:hypothetical protein